MTSANANDDQAVMRPTASMNPSMPSANFSAGVTSGLENFIVVDGFAVARPLFVLGHVAHVGLVHLFGDGILCHGLGENLLVGGAQRGDNGIRQRLRRDALVLDQIFHRLGVVLLAPGLAGNVARGAGVLDNGLKISREAPPFWLVYNQLARGRGLMPAGRVIVFGGTMQPELAVEIGADKLCGINHAP